MKFQHLAHRGQIVKICGLRDPEHAAVAAGAGADMIGFIFAPARRQVTSEVARSCVDAAKAKNPGVLAVGVFVDAPLCQMQEAVETAGLDLVQLNGDSMEDAAEALGVPILKALRPQPGVAAIDTITQIAELLASEAAPAAFLIDGYVAGAHGGAGVRADWDLARSVCRRHPVMLAGGLDPQNVEQAIQLVAPLGVDVSSGVEIDGRKDGDLIVSFIRRARTAFHAAG